jgi:hypothetical protein
MPVRNTLIVKRNQKTAPSQSGSRQKMYSNKAPPNRETLSDKRNPRSPSPRSHTGM